MRYTLPVSLGISLCGIAVALLYSAWSDLLLLAGLIALARRLVIDGSNVVFWRDNHPKLQTVIELLDLLRGKGYTPYIIFDASAGHVLFGRYLDDRHFAKLLNLPEPQCLVVPKGTVADEHILRSARTLRTRIVSNDRYRDWARHFPEVAKPGHLIRGRIEKGAIKLHRLALPRRADAWPDQAV